MSVQSYERVPYQSKPYAVAHTGRLAMMARLFGHTPPDPTRARVLEIGCAGGGHLLPQALVFPHATWLGIDPARAHVREAEQVAFALGLRNARVEQRGVESLSDADGTFDYIVAHGVFSWLPGPLRTTLLRACRDRLAPDGVAYISYNTLPGWHMRRMVRDAMRFHVDGIEDPTRRVEQARAMLDFLTEAVSPHGASPWGRFLLSERQLLHRHRDDYLFHDHLAEDNEPVYVSDFVALAAEAGLDWLGESELSDMMTHALAEGVRETLARIAPDVVRTQQYLDFLTNRAFRQSLLVHAGTPLDRTIRWTRVRGMHLSSPLRRPAEGPAPLAEGVELTFADRHGRELTTGDPGLKAAWLELQAHHPELLPFADWVTATRARLEAAGEAVPEDLEESLGSNALFALAQGMIELWPHPLPTGGHRHPTPAAFPLARLQALARGDWATSPLHVPVALDELDRRILALCDGTVPVEALAGHLEPDLASGALRLAAGDAEDAPVDAARAVLGPAVERRVSLLGRWGLLLPPDAPVQGLGEEFA